MYKTEHRADRLIFDGEVLGGRLANLLEAFGDFYICTLLGYGFDSATFLVLGQFSLVSTYTL